MKTSKLICCSFLFIAFTLCVDPSYAVNDVADSPLYGATMAESLSDLIAPQPPILANDDELQPEILRSAVIAPTKCPIQQKMTTCTEATTCVIEQTRCGNYTHCVTENDTERYCPAPTKWPSNLAVAATRCPNKKEATVCPFNETKCPEKDTICPNVADKVPTMCPESRTRCPEETTVCQKVNVSTECPEKETRCPVKNDTRCPDAKHKLPTVCPVVTTKCPIEEVATVCPMVRNTVCPEKETYCPKVNTECPGIPTKCVGANLATICPEIRTACPIIATKCNVAAPTMCNPVATNCPGGSTLCPQVTTVCPPVPTICVAKNTVCPAKATACPPRATACPKIAANCPPPQFPNVIINELFWCGSDLGVQDEYLELHNTSSLSIDISGWEIWKLNDEGVEEVMLTIPPGSTILPDGYYLITHFAAGASRLKDTILPDLVDENLDLRDKNAMYKLIDTNGSLRDVADDGEGLPLAGKAAPYYVSMERNYKSLKDGTIKASWQDSIGLSATYFDTGFDGRGTPGAQNSPAK